MSSHRCHRTALTLSDVDVDEAWLNVGLVLRAQGRYAEATEALHKCIGLDSKCADAHESLDSMEGIEAAIADANTLEEQ
jgi:hypothetical protein